MSEKKPIFGVIIEKEKSVGFGLDYLKLNARVVVIDEKSDNWSNVGSIGYSDYTVRDKIDNLQATAQTSLKDDPRRFYGFSVRYKECYSLELRELETKFKYLKNIENKLQKFNEKEGYVDCAATFLFRFCKVVDAKYCFFANNKSDSDYKMDSFEIDGRLMSRLQFLEREIIAPVDTTA